MMIVWIAYCTAIGAVIAAAAAMAQRAALLRRWRLRHLWLGAMLLTAVVSFGSLLAASRSVSSVSVWVRATTALPPGGEVTAAPAPHAAAPSVSMAVRLLVAQAVQQGDTLAARLARFDALVVAGWALLSTVLALLVLRETVACRRLRHACEARHINGTHVLLTDNVGPAALGLGVTSVLLPRWALELEDHLLDLVLRHEREHLKAKDPLYLLVGLGVLVLLPWQLALWWMWQRLRLAIELDCDGRLLQGGQTTARYAQLLLLLSQRLGRPAPALQPFITVAAPLHPAQSHLATRIRIMTQPKHRHAPVQFGLAVLGVLSAAALASALPVPHAPITLLAPSSSVSGATTDVRRTAGTKAATAAVQLERSDRNDATNPAAMPSAAERADASSSQAPAVQLTEQDTAKVYFEYQVTKPVSSLPGTASPIYPAAEKAAGKEGTALAQFIVNKLGRPEPGSLKFLGGTILQADGKKVSVPKDVSAYSPFEIAVRDALPYMRFSPAELEGVAVRQLVQMPYVFALAKK